MTQQELDAEVTAMKTLCSKKEKSIARVYATWGEENGGRVRFVVMEMGDVSLQAHMDYLASKYDLWDFCGRCFSGDPEILVPYRFILNGLEYIHSLGYVHRNLKPSNGDIPNAPNDLFIRVNKLHSAPQTWSRWPIQH